MGVIQFIIPWTVVFSPVLSQLNGGSELSLPQSYPIDPAFYNHFLTNQAQINRALLMPSNLIPANTRLPTQQVIPSFQQHNLGLNPNNVDIFNQQLQNFNQLPPQAFFDPLAIQQPISDLKVPSGISPSIVVPSQSESFLGGIPSPSQQIPLAPRALTVKSFVGIEKSESTTTESATPSTTIRPDGDSEQVRLIRKLLEETLASEREKSTLPSTTTTHPSTTEKEEKSSIEGFADFGVLDRLNLNELEKRAIVQRVEELLRAEIARKLLSEVSPPPPPPPPLPATPTPPPIDLVSSVPSTASTTASSTTLHPPTTASPSTTESYTLSTTVSTTVSPTTTTSLQVEDTTISHPKASTPERATASPTEISEKTQPKSFALKQKKSSQVGGRSVVRPLSFSESIDEPVSRLRVSSVQKEIRESQPRLPTRYIHNTKENFEEDLDLIDRSGGSNRRPDTAAAASLLTSARRITYPHDYEEETVTPTEGNEFFQPATGAPLDLSDGYEDEESEGLVDLDLSQRRREQFAAIATPSPFSLRTTARPFHEETTTSPSPSSPFPSSDPINLETVTTPPYRYARFGQHRATKFEVLASDYRSRLGEAGDLGHILKRLSQNAYIALIETDGGKKRTRHGSRRNYGRL